jgi:hypothetical protein
MTTTVTVNLDLPAGYVGGDFGGAFAPGLNVTPGALASSVSLTPTDATGGPSSWTLAFQYGGYPGRRSSLTTPVPAGPMNFAVTAGALTNLAWTQDYTWITAFPVGLPVGTQITVAGGSLPSGLAAGTYYVLTTGLNGFTVSATPGGSVVTCAGPGSGNFTVAAYNYTGLLAASQARSTTSPVSLPNPAGTPTQGYLVTADDNGSPVWAQAKAPQVTFITATGATVYNVPAGAQTVFAYIMGGGGQGASGGLTASGAAGGGGGGSAGGYSWGQFPASLLGSSVTVTVGAGGTTGGAAQTSVGTTGNAGQAGGSTLFGGFMWTHGGAAGNAGATAATAGGASGGGVGMLIGGGSGAGSATATAGGTGLVVGGAGGGGGGGGTTGAADGNGGGCSASFFGASNNTGAGGIAASNTAATAANAPTQGGPGGGGGGGYGKSGAASTAGAGANAAANTGAGGGGGGGCSGGTSSGAGGTGGSGYAVIIAYFQ